MIYKVKCPKCGKEQIIEVDLVAEQQEEEKTFGFIGEKLEIIETDYSYCKKCGTRLPIP